METQFCHCDEKNDPLNQMSKFLVQYVRRTQNSAILSLKIKKKPVYILNQSFKPAGFFPKTEAEMGFYK